MSSELEHDQLVHAVWAAAGGLPIALRGCVTERYNSVDSDDFTSAWWAAVAAAAAALSI